MPPPGVLHLVSVLTMGGSERQMLALIGGLSPEKWRPFVGYVRRGTGDLMRGLEALGVDPWPVPLYGSLARANTFWQAVRLAWRCRREGIRIVHAHDLCSDVLAVLIARLARLPCIASRRDLADWRSPHERRLMRFVERSADRLLVNAQAVADAAQADGTAPQRIWVAENGIDLAAFDAAAVRAPSPALPPDRGCSRIAMVGNMDRHLKGHRDLIAAAEALARSGRRIEWLLPSDGPLRAAFEAEARARDVDDCIHFLGRRSDIPSLLSRVDLVVHPSWSEGFPNAVLEAMSAARPVVATRVGACASLIEDGVNGRLVPPRDPQALAASVAGLLDDPAARTAMGRAARRRVERSFTLDRMARRVETLYETMVRE